MSVFINLPSPLSSAWSRGYLFYSLGYNPTLLYFVAQSVEPLVTGGSVRLAPVSFRGGIFVELFAVESTLTGGLPLNVKQCDELDKTSLLSSLRGKETEAEKKVTGKTS